MHPQLSREFVTDALSQSILDPRCRALYDLCYIQRDHLRREAAAEKLRMMMRLYAEQGMLPAGFSLETTTLSLQRACVDCWFSAMATAECLDTALVLNLHKRLMDLFPELPRAEACALASRYLHFHFPELFFVFDSRVEAVALVLTRGEGEAPAGEEQDPGYARFVGACLELVDGMVPLVGRRLSPRELDRVLRAWVDRRVVLPALSDEAALATLHG